jgi:hypothetical protein
MRCEAKSDIHSKRSLLRVASLKQSGVLPPFDPEEETTVIDSPVDGVVIGQLGVNIPRYNLNTNVFISN